MKNLQLKSIIARTHTRSWASLLSAFCLVSSVLIVVPLVRNIKTSRPSFPPPPSPAVSSRRNVCSPGKLASASRHLTMMNAVPQDAAYKILPNAKNYKKHRLLEESGEPAWPWFESSLIIFCGNQLGILWFGNLIRSSPCLWASTGKYFTSVRLLFANIIFFAYCNRPLVWHQ